MPFVSVTVLPATVTLTELVMGAVAGQAPSNVLSAAYPSAVSPHVACEPASEPAHPTPPARQRNEAKDKSAALVNVIAYACRLVPTSVTPPRKAVTVREEDAVRESYELD